MMVRALLLAGLLAGCATARARTAPRATLEEDIEARVRAYREQLCREDGDPGCRARRARPVAEVRVPAAECTAASAAADRGTAIEERRLRVGIVACLQNEDRAAARRVSREYVRRFPRSPFVRQVLQATSGD